MDPYLTAWGLAAVISLIVFAIVWIFHALKKHDLEDESELLDFYIDPVYSYETTQKVTKPKTKREPRKKTKAKPRVKKSKPYKFG